MLLPYQLNLSGAGGGYATPDLSFDFDSGVDGVKVDPLDTPSAGDTAFDAVTENTASGGVFKYDSALPAHGALGLRVATVATSVSAFAQWDITGSGLDVYFRTAVRIPTGTTFAARHDFWQYRDASTRTRFAWDTSRRLQVVNGGTVVGTMTNAIAVDTDYRVEGRMFIDAAAGVLEVKLFVGDSETPVEVLTVTGLNTGTTECTNLRGGLPFATANFGPVYFDDWGLSFAGYMGPAVTGGGAIATGGRTSAAAASRATQVRVARGAGVAAAAGSSRSTAVRRVVGTGRTAAAGSSTAADRRVVVGTGTTSAAAASFATRVAAAIVGRGVTAAAASSSSSPRRRAVVAATSPAAATSSSSPRRVASGRGTTAAAATSTALERRVVVGRGTTPTAATSSSSSARRILGTGSTAAAATSSSTSLRRIIGTGVGVAVAVSTASRSLARAQAGVTAAAVVALGSSARRILARGVAAAAAAGTAAPRRVVVGRGTTVAAAASTAADRRVVVGRGTTAAAGSSRSTAVRRAVVAARAVAAAVSTALRPVVVLVVGPARMRDAQLDVASMTGQVSDTGSGAVARVVDDPGMMTTSSGARIRDGDAPSANMTEG